MQKILVTTDFSPSAQNAVNIAAHLAGELKYSLQILHCYHIPVPATDLPFPPVSVKEIEDNVSDLLKKQETKLRSQFPNLVIELAHQEGLAQNDIVSLADSTNAIEVVVMGLTGAGALAKWLFGSTSLHVARNCSKPVMLVPEDASWNPLNEIVLACDYKSMDNVTGVDMFVDLVKLYNSNVSILSVMSPGAIPTIEQAANVVKIDHKFSDLKHTYHFVEDKNVEDGLDKFLAGKKVKMVVLVRRKHNWFERLISGGHTGKMAYHAHTPVLVLHEK